jgi:hypothetical protein
VNEGETSPQEKERKLPPWSKVLLEKLIFTQLFKTFLAFYDKRAGLSTRRSGLDSR